MAEPRRKTRPGLIARLPLVGGTTRLVRKGAEREYRAYAGLINVGWRVGGQLPGIARDLVKPVRLPKDASRGMRISQASSWNLIGLGLLIAALALTGAIFVAPALWIFLIPGIVPISMGVTGLLYGRPPRRR